jgi:hypothetical protein
MSGICGSETGITRESVSELIKREPYLGMSQGFLMVLNWLTTGGETAFLQDGNSLQMETGKLVNILKHLKDSFPSLKRVTSYARAKTLRVKTHDELTAIREAGLDRLHVGLETGDNRLLESIKKGVTAEEHIKAGRKAMSVGFQLSEYWMPGLGGRERWKEHAVNTAKVANAIGPHYLRSRPFFPALDTPMAEACSRGDVTPLSARERLEELRLTVETLDFDSRLCFDHAGNHWRNLSGGSLFSLSYEGYKFPEEKGRVLELIAEGVSAIDKWGEPPQLERL